MPELTSKSRKPKAILFDGSPSFLVFGSQLLGTGSSINTINTAIDLPCNSKIIRMTTYGVSINGTQVAINLVIGTVAPTGVAVPANTYGSPGSTQRSAYSPYQTRPTGDAGAVLIGTAGQSYNAAAPLITAGANATQLFLPDNEDGIYPGGFQSQPVTLRISTGGASNFSGLTVSLMVIPYDYAPWDPQNRTGTSGNMNFTTDF